MPSCVLRDVGVCALAIVLLNACAISLAGSILLSSLNVCHLVFSFSFSCPLLLLRVLVAASSAGSFSLLSCDADTLVLSEDLVGMVVTALLISSGGSDGCCFFEEEELCWFFCCFLMGKVSLLTSFGSG